MNKLTWPDLNHSDVSDPDEEENCIDEQYYSRIDLSINLQKWCDKELMKMRDDMRFGDHKWKQEI